MKEEQIHTPLYMPRDDFQMLLERYYQYGEGWVTRWAHRLRINCINNFIDSYAKDLHSHASRRLTALDLGCGRGVYAYLLAQRGFQTFGIDISEEGIRDAAEWASATVLLGDAERLPFRDGFFDLIVCSEVIEHLNKPANGVRELQRVLKPGGIAVISIPNLLSYYWLRGLAMTLASHLKRGRFRKLDIDAHMKFPFWRISRIVKQAGLKTLIRTSVFLSFPLMGSCILRIPSTIGTFSRQIERILGRVPLLKNFGAFYILVCIKI